MIKEFNGYFNKPSDEFNKDEKIVGYYIQQDQINFIMEMISIIQQYKPTFSPADTILGGEVNDCVIPIIRMKSMDNISLYVYLEKDVSNITLCWGQINHFVSNDDLDDGYAIANFSKKNDSLWKMHALERFKKELEREIQVSTIYVENKPIEIQYHIKNDADKYIGIGSKTIAEFSFRRIFKPKTKKSVMITFGNKEWQE